MRLGGAEPTKRVSLPVEADFCGRFVRHYKRFLADIITDDALELRVTPHAITIERTLPVLL